MPAIRPTLRRAEPMRHPCRPEATGSLTLICQWTESIAQKVSWPVALQTQHNQLEITFDMMAGCQQLLQSSWQ